MELDGENLFNDSEESFSDLSLVAPCSLNVPQEENSFQSDHLFRAIRKNLWGCDLMLSLFAAALHSYRADRCLRPFPPSFIKEDGKDFDELRIICDNIPSLETILTEPKKCSGDALRLLKWLLLEKGHPALKRINSSTIQFPSEISKVFKPQYVFEVCYNHKTEQIWQKRVGDRDIILAYHGSAIDNFYSILKVGLQQHFSVEKEVLFGKGIYFSNELTVSAHYSPFGQTWQNSALGSKQSIIAVCELINDSEKVKCKDSNNKQRSVSKDSVWEIPERYFVVTNSDMVRVKYLMVYREKSVFSVRSYITDHFFIILIVFYVMLIVIVGLFNNTSFWKMTRKLRQMFSFN